MNIQSPNVTLLLPNKQLILPAKKWIMPALTRSVLNTKLSHALHNVTGKVLLPFVKQMLQIALHIPLMLRQSLKNYVKQLAAFWMALNAKNSYAANNLKVHALLLAVSG